MAIHCSSVLKVNFSFLILGQGLLHHQLWFEWLVWNLTWKAVSNSDFNWLMQYEVKEIPILQLVRLRPHNAGGIWKRSFYFENASNVFRPHYAGKMWKLSNKRPFCICVWENLGQDNHMIMTSSFLKNSLLKCFPSTLKRKAGVFKFLWFEECFRKTPFSWRINLDRRPNRRNKAVFSRASDIILRCDCTFC